MSATAPGAPGTASSDHAAARRRTKRLLERYHRFGDRAARDQAIEHFLPLARQLARRYARGRESLDDLVQVASVGLVKAVDRFDVDRGVSFSSYAVPTIVGELRRYFRDTGWAVHVPRGLQERALAVEHAAEELSAHTGQSPSPALIAERMGCGVEEVLEAMDARRAGQSVSLDAPQGGSDGDEGESRGDLLGAEDSRYELIEYGSSIAGIIGALPDRDRRVLYLRFVEDLTQTQIAEQIGVSQMQVSRLMRRSLDRLRTVADATSPRALR